jgi:hypothetical protein
MEPVWAIQFLGSDRKRAVSCRFRFDRCDLPVDDEPGNAGAITNRLCSVPVEKGNGLGGKVGRNSSSLTENLSAGYPEASW